MSVTTLCRTEWIRRLKKGSVFHLHNKTDICTYVKRVDHMLFGTDMLQPLSRSTSG